MTPKELLGMSADDIEKMSDAELEKVFSPLFHVTRPEMQRQGTLVPDGPIKPPTKRAGKSNQAFLLNKAKDLARQYGIDLKGI